MFISVNIPWIIQIFPLPFTERSWRYRILIVREEIALCSLSSTESIASTKYKLEGAMQVKHHSLEKFLLAKATCYLLENQSYKTVLVDIFARVNGQVKILPDSCVETHTVVLYKQFTTSGQYQAIVIDPSNFLYSSHLAKFEGIKTIHKGLQIYKAPSENTGVMSNQYRDCIDISVKIAFWLSNLELKTIINPDFAKELGAVKGLFKEISNDPAIDDSIVSRKLPARIKQASDTKIVKAFSQIEQAINKTITMLMAIDQGSKRKLTDEHEQILSSSKEYKEILHDLVMCNKMLEQSIELVGNH